MKIYQWLAACTMMLSTACSNQVFTPSADFEAQKSYNSISTEDLLRVSSGANTIDFEQEIKVMGWLASSDVNVAEDTERDPIAIDIQSFQEKVEILSKASHEGSNFMLTQLKDESYVWLKY